MNKFVFAAFLLLSACQSQKGIETKANRRDGPPAKPPKSMVYQHVSPKNEPLSRYGNPSSYEVKGREFEVLPSSKGYHQKGLASWYGTKFHKERTSSGEAYNMYALTAAHRTLPLPSYVHIKNLDNGREAVVKVNDRGPFHSDRIIDLSYGAASKLGVLAKGTARVEIKALGSSPAAKYYLQVGAFQSQNTADALRNKLIKLHQSPKVEVKKHDARYVVQMGPFQNKKHSQDFNNMLKAHGIRGAYAYLQ